MTTANKSGKKTVLVIFGGRSAEHEVSVVSARNVTAALDRKQFDVCLVGISRQGTWYSLEGDKLPDSVKSLDDHQVPVGFETCSLTIRAGKPELIRWNHQKSYHVDIAFPVLHGTYGEDGCIQGLFEMVNLPYVGCGVLASSIGMDKSYMKKVLQDVHIPSAKYVTMTDKQKHSYDYLTEQLGSPFFIKPASQGSSVGVHKIKSEAEFTDKLKDAFQYDHKVLAEEFIEGREIECAVMGTTDTPKASVCGEIMPQHEFYSYEAKYIDENGASTRTPADLKEDVAQTIRELATRTYTAMGCEGLTRVDFFLRKDGKIFVNEINTLPGFTNISMYPKMWEASGTHYGELITQLIRLGEESFARKSLLRTQFPIPGN